jgi:ribonuclease PH
MRIDKRKNNQLRPVKITAGYLNKLPESVLVQFGDTAVICSASIDEKVPPFLKGQGRGWVTAEYAMLPGSGSDRVSRENFKSGRSLEISRLIGRSLRMSTNLQLLGERTITIDCDVLQADGGTRTAAITGGWVALNLAARKLASKKMISRSFITNQVAAVSAGIYHAQEILDLCYVEDSQSEVDMNIVALRKGGLAEVQGTAEKKPFSLIQMDKMVKLALSGIDRLFTLQTKALK